MYPPCGNSLFVPSGICTYTGIGGACACIWNFPFSRQKCTLTIPDGVTTCPAQSDTHTAKGFMEMARPYSRGVTPRKQEVNSYKGRALQRERWSSDCSGIVSKCSDKHSPQDRINGWASSYKPVFSKALKRKYSIGKDTWSISLLFNIRRISSTASLPLTIPESTAKICACWDFLLFNQSCAFAPLKTAKPQIFGAVTTKSGQALPPVRYFWWAEQKQIPEKVSYQATFRGLPLVGVEL